MLTVGHSTLPSEIFLKALQENGVETLVDVRTVPRSRHNPQFSAEPLAASLATAQIGYRPMQALGGLRQPKKDSVNTGWRNSSFRGYADYMQTEAFSAALQALAHLDDEVTIAIMCAEAVPWRCHRSLIADAMMVVHGRSVYNLFVTPAGNCTRKVHALTPFARVEGARLWYPDPEELPWPEKISAAENI
ncbi:MAG TPA: DUF488 domain-containing protein [Acidobacteriaceae bacterium]|nr:DUF488 domain-containing protein [Acidobacteriaceae bacterium]